MKYNTESIKIYVVILILILSIIAVSTNYWSINSITLNNDPDSNITNITSDYGLWNFCQSQGNNRKTCINTMDISSNNLKNLKTVRILSISSLVLIALSLYLLYAMPNQKEYFILCVVLSGILSIISVILWNNDPAFKNIIGSIKHGYSWYLELISGLIAILLGILTQFNII